MQKFDETEAANEAKWAIQQDVLHKETMLLKVEISMYLSKISIHGLDSLSLTPLTE